MEYALYAGLLGGISSVSLLIGAGCGLVMRPRPPLTAAMTAFGGGALLAALSVEIVAKTALKLNTGGAQNSVRDFLVLLLGCLAGGIVFVVLDQLINVRGGYLRKTATTILFMNRRQKQGVRSLISEVSKIDFLRGLPPRDIQAMVDLLQFETFEEGEILFAQGVPGDAMYFIERGRVSLSDQERGDFMTLDAGDVFGEISLVTGAARTAEARALGKTHVLTLERRDFERLRKMLPELDQAVKNLAAGRLEEVEQRRREHYEKEAEWYRDARRALRTGAAVPSAEQVRRIARSHSGAPFAIWLGILLDGIPESFVIGSSFLALVSGAQGEGKSLGEMIPYTLLAGLFLSNFPEAFSSSVGMKSQEWSRGKILALWFSICAATGLGAILGYELGASLHGAPLAFIEGLAAGAMLTMIAQTMIPEAVHLGNPILSGLSTLFGFVSALAFKLLEH